MLKNDMRIDEIYISNKLCDLVTHQSCDCKEILIKTGDLFYLVSHQFKDDDGYIKIKCVDGFDPENFTHVVKLAEEDFYFDKIQNGDTGYIAGIRFRSENLFLFIFSLEYNLVLTQTTYDLFNEIQMDIPQENDEPLLQIEKMRK
jgi:hypothetical protein